MPALIFAIILAVILFVFINVLIMAHFGYVYTFKVKNRNPDPYRVVREGDPKAEFRRELADKILKEDFTDIFIKSHDGLSLRGRMKIVSEGAPFAIMCHGYRSSPLIDFSGIAMLVMDLGFNVILIDQRAHGMSEGKCLTFGIRESRDAADWARYVEKNYGADVILFGVSMGAATVLISSGLSDLPKCVKGVFADCPFSSAKGIMQKEMASRKLGNPKLLYTVTKLGARIFGGFNPDDSRPIDSIMNANVPIELVHGECDTFVPYYMSDEMHKAAGIPLHSFKEATHGTAFVYEPDRYREIVESFCKRCLEKDKTEKEA